MVVRPCQLLSASYYCRLPPHPGAAANSPATAYTSTPPYYGPVSVPRPCHAVVSTAWDKKRRIITLHAAPSLAPYPATRVILPPTKPADATRSQPHEHHQPRNSHRGTHLEMKTAVWAMCVVVVMWWYFNLWNFEL